MAVGSRVVTDRFAAEAEIQTTRHREMPGRFLRRAGLPVSRESGSGMQPQDAERDGARSLQRAGIGRLKAL